MKLNEVMGELIPYDDSTAMRLAKEIYRGSGGDVEKARNMTNALRQQILKNIEKHDKMASMSRVGRGSRVEKRPPGRGDVPGYQGDRGSESTFSATA